VTIVSVEFSAEEVNASPFRSERIGCSATSRINGAGSSSARAPSRSSCTLATAVEEEDPDLVIEVIREVVQAAR
jgi:hypothetical protein